METTEPISLTDFQAIDPEAHALALTIISECGGDDDEPAPEPTGFRVFLEPNGSYTLQWNDYGPFNPVPEWAWDPDAKEWADSEEDYERFLALGGKD